MHAPSTQPDWSGLHVHFVAVGGIGMSALAKIAHARGAIVTGCDGADGPMLAELRRCGVTCLVGHSPDHLKGIQLVVYSTAVPQDCPELVEARRLRIPIISRGKLLAWLQRGCETVAVAGTHGKTTTTWIVANMLVRCGLDPTVAVGGTVADLGGNARVGAGSLFVTEADESDRSFLLLRPTYPLITNIDADHHDHYPGGLEEIKKAFVEFVDHTADGGALIACADSPAVRDIRNQIRTRTITYGIGRADVRAENVRLLPGRAVYDVTLSSGTVRDVVLSLPGTHNLLNSLAALALAEELDLPLDTVLEAFAHTARVDRRLERRGVEHGVSVYDDYAHHPAEIAATLAAARMLADNRLIGVFQPHRYSRTLHLHQQFGPAFDELDLLIIAPIYAASETPVEGVSAKLIADQIQKQGHVPCELTPSLDPVPDRLLPELAEGDTVITLGAGDVWRVGDALLEKMKRAGIGHAADAAG